MLLGLKSSGEVSCQQGDGSWIGITHSQGHAASMKLTQQFGLMEGEASMVRLLYS